MKLPMDEMRKNSDSPNSSAEKCPRCENRFLYNFDTSEIIQVSCKAYKCAVCGPRKRFKLQKAIEKHVSKWDRIRMFTFTFSSNVFLNQNMKEKLQLASKIWKTFRDSCRKSHVLTQREKDFQYIKTIELQENGSPHFHCLIDRYLFFSKINKIWKSAIRQNTDYEGNPGSINISGGIRKGDAGKYITKYVTKQLIDFETKYNFRRWSKSGVGTIFETREKSGDWLFISLYSSSISPTSVIEFAIFQKNLAKKAPNQLFALPIPAERGANIFLQYGSD